MDKLGLKTCKSTVWQHAPSTATQFPWQDCLTAAHPQTTHRGSSDTKITEENTAATEKTSEGEEGEAAAACKK